MSNSYEHPMYEFLVWNDCGNNCRFCWQKHFNDKTKMLESEADKTKSLQEVFRMINDPEFFEAGSDILLCGGEIFDNLNYNLDLALQDIIRLIVDKIKKKEIRYFYMNTNLIYKDLTDLSVVLQYLATNDVLGNFIFTTSYDIYGRYKDKEAETLFLRNLKVIKASFPNINIAVNMIMTKQLCSEILDNGFSIKEFSDFYQVKVNTIPYITLHEDMQPTKNEVFKALLKIDKELPGYFKHYTENFDLDQKKILLEYIKDIGYQECTSEYDDCGHNTNFKKAFSDGSCYICNCKNLLESM